eukprot:1856961-Rhodomonas_salina.3
MSKCLVRPSCAGWHKYTQVQYQTTMCYRVGAYGAFVPRRSIRYPTYRATAPFVPHALTQYHTIAQTIRSRGTRRETVRVGA